MATAAGKVCLNFLAVYIERLNFVWNDNLKYIQALEILMVPLWPYIDETAFSSILNSRGSEKAIGRYPYSICCRLSIGLSSFRAP